VPIGRIPIRYDARRMCICKYRCTCILCWPHRTRRKETSVNLAPPSAQDPRLEHATWRKSRHSNPSGNCVEIAALRGGTIAIRNSRHPGGPALIIERDDFAAFLAGAADGDFDYLPC
jgi:hypothetical protein